MSGTAIDKEINDYLTQLTIKQKEAVLGVIKTFAEKMQEDMWKDTTYINEMNKRFEEMEKGKVKTFTLDEVEVNARNGYQARKSKI